MFLSVSKYFLAFHSYPANISAPERLTLTIPVHKLESPRRHSFRWREHHLFISSCHLLPSDRVQNGVFPRCERTRSSKCVVTRVKLPLPHSLFKSRRDQRTGSGFLPENLRAASHVPLLTSFSVSLRSHDVPIIRPNAALIRR